MSSYGAGLPEGVQPGEQITEKRGNEMDDGERM